MTEDSPLNDEERDELVAYLDGELEPPRAQAMEARLNVDARVRAEADQLRRAWDMLDYLPRAQPSPHFTERTLQRVAPVPTDAFRLPAPKGRRWLLRAAWAAGIVLAGVGGYWGTNWFRPRSSADQDLVHDLRVIENKRLYEQVDGIDMLKELDRPELFGDDSQDS